jgi:hypothetical protein
MTFPTMAGEGYWSAGKCARYYDIHDRTWRRWIAEGLAPEADLVINGRGYWKPESLLAFDRKRSRRAQSDDADQPTARLRRNKAPQEAA